MNEIPNAETIRTSYENFVVQCPHCREEIIFNRATDLKDVSPIAFRTVLCLNPSCGEPFNINGDSVASAHKMLIYDCYELINRKHYMNCILTLAQAYEVFFSLYFRVELLYKPFGANRHQKPADLKRISEKLHDKVKKHTFTGMRALFLHHMVTGQAPKNLAEAKNVVAALPDQPGDPKDKDIESLSDAKLVSLLKALKATSINNLRNNIVHKQAYRPTRGEVEAALTETRSILLPLTSHLQLYDDINWYMRKP